MAPPYVAVPSVRAGPWGPTLGTRRHAVTHEPPGKPRLSMVSEGFKSRLRHSRNPRRTRVSSISHRLGGQLGARNRLEPSAGHLPAARGETSRWFHETTPWRRPERRPVSARRSPSLVRSHGGLHCIGDVVREPTFKKYQSLYRHYLLAAPLDPE
jgi:hypothetical protein